MKRKRKRKRIYDEKVLKILKYLWELSDFLCGKRLVPFIRNVLPILIREGEIVIEKELEEKLMKISPATRHRILSSHKKELELRSRSKTKPGTLLKNKIPIRTFSDWDEKKPGFLEIDLVGYDGGDVKCNRYKDMLGRNESSKEQSTSLGI